MALANYLSHYAETHTRQLNDFSESYDYVCVVPCFDETEAFLLTNEKVFRSTSSLLILVINQAPATIINANNLALQQFIGAAFARLWRSRDQALTLYRSGANSHILCVDAYSPGRELAAKQGVGLARKIGADIACQLFYCGKIVKPWIFNTDADVKLPENYFSSTASATAAAALVFPYEHSRPNDPKQALAIDLYDYGLRYYAAALHWAGSPYAFQTVGSTLVIHANYYAKVRGFPKRNAGEDFYILNKLRKTGNIVCLSEPLLTVAARTSNRTPFGTGAAMRQIMQLDDAECDYVFYHPLVFDLLRVFLQALPDIWRLLRSDSVDDELIQTTIAAVIAHEKLMPVLHTLDVASGVRHAFSHSKTFDGFSKHMHDWFDAFRTLKLVHGLRDRYYPSINIRELGALTPAFLPASACARRTLRARHTITESGVEYPP